MSERSERMPTVSAPAASSLGVPYLAAGILAADGRLHAGVTVDEAVAVLGTLRPRLSLWAPKPFADESEAELGLRYHGQLPAGWVAPDPQVADESADVLRRAWEAAGLTGSGAWSRPALRLRVGSIDDHRRLHGHEVDGIQVVAHLPTQAYHFAWRWPMRVACLGSLTLDDVDGSRLGTHYELAAPGDPIDIAVVRADDVAAVVDARPAVALVVDVGSRDAADIFSAALAGRVIAPAAVALVPSLRTGLVDGLAVELSHDQPLDVSLARVEPDAVLAASGDLLAMTSIRMWAWRLGLGLSGDHAATGERLRQIARSWPFDREVDGGSDVSREAASLPPGLVDQLTSVSLLQSGPAPTHQQYEQERWQQDQQQQEQQQQQPEQVHQPLPVEHPGAGAEDEEIIDRGITIDLDHVEYETDPSDPRPPDAAPGEAARRRLQAEVLDGDGTVRVDGFVTGQRHQLRVRIAAAIAAGTVAADRGFISPVLGKPVDLTVIAKVRGGTARPVRRALRLPADADSEWTKSIPVRVPDAATDMAVELVVLYEGRAVQTAVLAGPVVVAGPVASPALTLRVDADAPVDGIAGRAGAAATLMLSLDADGSPQLVDLSVVGRTLPFDRLAKATKAVRGILLDAFTDASRERDLAGAAPVLTKLAVRGATLRNQLKGTADSFHDDDAWIHVVAFGPADVPLELIYTHPMPDRDDEVPICDTALGGADSCSASCTDRGRSDRVCPFGFWGTSKVVERRRHIDDRVGVVAPLERTVSLTSAAVVGTSTKTDIDDNQASTRIVRAVEDAVAAGSFRRVMSWGELQTAVTSASPGVLVLVTHTVKGRDPDDDLGISLELGGDERAAHRIDQSFVNPSSREPGPVVISLGCDTGDLDVGFADWVGTLHAARAELVVSTIAPVPGKEVADFLERMFAALPIALAGEGPFRFGDLLTAVRRAIIATGDVLALAITASGDADVQLVGGGVGDRD